MLKLILLTTAASFALATPSFAADKTPAKAAVEKPQKDYVILKVGGEEIKYSELKAIWANLFKGEKTPEFDTFDETIKQNVVRGVASERLIYKEAVKEGYDKNEEVLKKLEQLKKQIIMQSFIEGKAKTLVSDAELKKLYAQKIEAMKDNEEIHARHILLPTDQEEQAKKLSAELKKGGNFEKAAKEFSKDPGSAEKGGDLGYFSKDARMVPEFLTAAFALKKGEVSAPVKTGFGWHIIKIDDRRKVKAPSFDEMKESLRGELQEKAVQNYVEGLLKNNEVKYFAPDGSEKPLPKELLPTSAPAAKK